MASRRTNGPLPPPRVRSRLWPTWEGFLWLALALVLFAQGYLRGVNLVALIACLLVALWLINVVWVLTNFRFRALRARRRIAEPVFAGEPFTVTLELENPRRRTVPPLRVVDRGSHHQHAWFVPSVGPRATVQGTYQANLPRRGQYAWPTLTLTTGYPFGLLRRWLYVDPHDLTLVLPQLGRLDRGRLQRLLLERPQPSSSQRKPIRRHAAAQTEFYGLREFRAGDSPRWIHWRTTARRGELMVREFVEPPLENLTVILEPWLPDTIERLLMLGQLPLGRNGTTRGGPARSPRESLALLEKAVSLAATLCWEWARSPGSRVALGIADQQADARMVDAGPRTALTLLERLTLVSGTPRPAATELLGQLQQQGIPQGPVILVSTRAATTEGLFAAGLGRPVVVLNVADPLVDQLFSVGPLANALGTATPDKEVVAR